MAAALIGAMRWPTDHATCIAMTEGVIVFLEFLGRYARARRRADIEHTLNTSRFCTCLLGMTTKPLL